jgi:hypothetical protein
VHRFIREDEFTIFSYIQELSHFVNHLAMNSVRMPRIMWQNDGDQEFVFDGRLFTIAAFRAMYAKLLANTTTLLHDGVLLGLVLPDIHKGQIVDVLSDTTPGYSFLTDKSNQFYKHNQFLIRAMTDPSTSRNKYSYQAYSNSSGIVWNLSGIHSA